MFRIVSTIEEIDESVRPEAITPEVISKEFEGIVIEYIKLKADKGSLLIAGSQDKLAHAACNGKGDGSK